MRTLIVAVSLLVAASAWAAPRKTTTAPTTGLTLSKARAAVKQYLGQVPGGWTINLSKYRQDIKEPRPGMLVVGGMKKMTNAYLWRAVSKQRIDNDPEPTGDKFFRSFEGKVMQRKSGKVEAWRFPTFEEWQQTN